MSKSLVDYGAQKSCAVTTAKRLADLLGPAMVQDKGLRCTYVIAQQPQGTPVSDRAVPVALFGKEVGEVTRSVYLRKWCKILSDNGIRSIIDWSYYKQRLCSTIQKIITIPAAMQKVSNPVPRVVHPDWLHKKVREKEDRFRQRKLKDIFTAKQQDNKTEDIADMEDLGTSKVGSGALHNPIARSYEANRENYPNKRVLASLQNNDDNAHNVEVDREKDYRGWLDGKKRKWKEVLEQKKRRRFCSANISSTVKDRSKLATSILAKQLGKSGVHTTVFRKQELALVKSHWQIIQLVPSSHLGCLSAWVVANGVMFKVPINVPRLFYINSRGCVPEEFPGRRVKKILPHSRPNYNLLEVMISEDKFKSESKKLEGYLAEPEVEGIYETKVTVDFSAILKLGCVCKVNKNATNRSLQQGWDLSELSMKTTAECAYLEQSISFFYLYHSLSEGRGVYVIYFPASHAINAIVVNPVRNRELTSGLLEKNFREACQTIPNDASSVSVSAFKVDYFQTWEAACKFLQTMLTDYRRQHLEPIIGLIECPSIHALKSNIRALDDYPCILVPCNARDSDYQALLWQVTAGKISMQRCVTSSQWFSERVLLSRYAHVPLGNFELDWLLFTSDIFFSRALKDQQQVLWISDDGIPDLGGTYEGDSCFADEVSQPELNNPGAYRRISVELKIHHLAVNSLLKSNQLDEMEGGPVYCFDQEAPPSEDDFDELVSCRPAFQVLKQLVQRCVSDVVSSGNVFADAILQHVYRWICSPSSKLHDPSLHRALHNVMRKVFALLIAELKKLGATVIFASFSRIIIDTGKIDLESAHAYCDCMLNTLQKRDLFEWIELEPVNYWHSLLFMDQYNFGGIRAKSGGPSPNEPQVDIILSWNIAQSLPKEIQDHFELIVSEFLYLPWKYLETQITRRTNTLDQTSSTPSITIIAAENIEDAVVDFLRNKIRSHFSLKLHKIVDDIMTHKMVLEKERDPTLEFVKHVFAVLCLDQSVQHDILTTRKNLLRLVGVKDFDQKVQFEDVCRSFCLPNVICSYCNDCRDLDLCRDSMLLNQEWRCCVPECGQPYNREKMENSLLQIVRQRERLYHLQDLLCTRCRHVKAAHLSDQCSCGGSFKCREGCSEYLQKTRIFLHISQTQKFRLLEDCTSTILENF